MAQDLASRQLVWYDRERLAKGATWHCDDCGIVIEGKEEYDRHVSCFPLHHPQPAVTLPLIKSPVLGEAT